MPTDDKFYCATTADSEDPVRQHAERGGVPANRISRVTRTIDPTTGEG